MEIFLTRNILKINSQLSKNKTTVNVKNKSFREFRHAILANVKYKQFHEVFVCLYFIPLVPCCVAFAVVSSLSCQFTKAKPHVPGLSPN